MTITKKDLLKKTGISYGQLYRWKRVGLIPEEWFIKQSSYTGQETIFPKDKVLERIKKIQELKDHYSLEELAIMLAPELVNNNIIEESILEQFHVVDIDVVNTYKNILKKKSIQYVEVILLYALSSELSLTMEKKDILKIIHHNALYLSTISNIAYDIVIIKVIHDYFILAGKDLSDMYIDTEIKVVSRIALDKINEEFKEKFKSII